MSPELIAILAMGFAVIGIQMTTFIYLMQRMDRIEARMTSLEVGLSGRMSSLEVETKESMAELRIEMVERMSTLEVSLTERVARLEGVVLGRMESGNGTLGTTGDD
ncbi:hypothetical protein GBAR_LOCUS11871 [Geodia barretti]|jgi:hypothetical protein|uniref:Uncharacterized protein n=1 Tax=Geodia barretti TaxID=519541 RepID=A0AA35RXX7_GEOBA|nr:hypothetical protein GBAR_LOCUS11871 [Geodia barretti]